MKKFLLALAAWLPLSTLIAQTILNQPFGSTAAQVLDFLATKDLRHVETREDGSIVASSDAYTVTYRFEDGGLYLMETVCDYDQRRDAWDRLVNLRTSMENRLASVMVLEDSKESARYVALDDRNLQEYVVVALPAGHSQLRVVDMDLDRSPGHAVGRLLEDRGIFALLTQ